MQGGDVLDAAGGVVTVDHRYEPHARIYYYRAIEDEPRIPFEETVLFQD